MKNNYLFFETNFNLLDKQKKSLDVKCYFELIDKITGETFVFSDEEIVIELNGMAYDLEELFEVKVVFDANTFNILYDMNPDFEPLLETFEIDVFTVYNKNFTTLISKSEFESILFSSNFFTFLTLYNKFHENPKCLTEQEKEVISSDDFWQWVLNNEFVYELLSVYNTLSIPYQKQQQVKKIILEEIWKYKSNYTDLEDFYWWALHVISELGDENSTFVDEDIFKAIILKLSKYQK
ncbi:MAG: hypothetical protein ACRDCC_08470 [Culicoidibacterales bacterium]